MKCLVLAAGYATRLYPLTKNFPKPLLKIKNETILDWLLSDLEKTNYISEFIIISNHKFYNNFVEWAKNKTYNLKILDDCSTDNENRLGAVNDIQFAIESLKIDEDILVIAGDNILDFSFKSFIDYAKQKKASCIFKYEEKDICKLQKAGVMIIDKDSKILELEEKPKIPKSNWCAPPFYYYCKKDVPMVKVAIDSGCKTDAPGSLVAWLCKQSDVYAFLMPGKRFDIGDIESYNYVQQVFNGLDLK